MQKGILTTSIEKDYSTKGVVAVSIDKKTRDARLKAMRNYFIKNAGKLTRDEAEVFFDFMYHEINFNAELLSQVTISKFKITANELRLMKLSAEGASLRGASTIMHKSMSRIKQYRSTITRKLEAENFTHALVIAVLKRVITVHQ